MNEEVSLTTIYDSYEYKPELRTGFGFACLVKISKNILFDTGSDSETLLYNMKQLGIDPESIEAVILSHNHGDHTGGLSGFLEANRNKAKVYHPTTFSRPTKIYRNIFSTGALGLFTKEQSLLVSTKKGLVVITGCAHPGIVKIVKKAKEVAKDIYLVLGGFHLGGASDSEINSIVKIFRDSGVKKVAPCHCTGDRAIRAFEEEYKNDFIKAGVGRRILI